MMIFHLEPIEVMRRRSCGKWEAMIRAYLENGTVKLDGARGIGKRLETLSERP